MSKKGSSMIKRDEEDNIIELLLITHCNVDCEGMFKRILLLLNMAAVKERERRTHNDSKSKSKKTR